MRRVNIVSWATEEWTPVIGQIPVEWRTANEVTALRQEEILEARREQERMFDAFLQEYRVNSETNSDDWLIISWAERRPKKEKVAYFITWKH